jgi:hypothetical protein
MAQLHRDPAAPPAPREYVVSRVEEVAQLRDLGREDAWTAAPTIAWGPTPFLTRFRALWTPASLFLRFDCEDDGPWSTRTERDARLWEEEVVEIFLDPCAAGRGYAEIEISPANVVCDLRIERGWPALEAEIGWDLDGLESEVMPWRGPGAGPAGWTALAQLPWAGLRTLSEEAARRVPPAPGDRWRFNVFRIKRPGGPADPERHAIYAAWSVPEGPSFHVPDVFRELVFGG